MQSFSDYVSGRREQRRSFIRKFETGFTSWLEMKHLTGMRVAAIASVTCTSHCSETKKGFTLLVQVMAVSERRVIPCVLSVR